MVVVVAFVVVVVALVVVVVGFVVALGLSFYLATPRIAIASASAFLIGQLLDIAIFSRLRNRFWIVPPLTGSLLGSLIDTLVFFTIAVIGVLGFAFDWLLRQAQRRILYWLPDTKEKLRGL